MKISHHEDGHDCQGSTNHPVHFLRLCDLTWLWCCADGEPLELSSFQVYVVVRLKALDILEVALANLWLSVSGILRDNGVHWPSHDFANGGNGTSSAVLEIALVVAVAF